MEGMAERETDGREMQRPHLNTSQGRLQLSPRHKMWHRLHNIQYMALYFNAKFLFIVY